MNKATPTRFLPPADVNPLEKIRDYARYAEIRQILDRVIHAQQQSGLKAIAVLSEFPAEGRTLMTSTLALGYADLARARTLVVDATMQPREGSLRLDRTLEADEIPDPDSAVRVTLSVQVDLMRLADAADETGGSPESRIPDLVNTYKSRYGLLLFDTTAMNARNRNNIDPIAVARRCQASILVVSRASASRGGLAAIEKRLRQERIELLGLVYNEGNTP